MKATRASASTPHDEHDGADTVERFAEKNAISRAQAYKEIAAGRLIARKVASRTIVTHEDAARWRRALPKVPANGAPKRPNDGLPVWLSEPRPARRRAKPKAPKATEPGHDVAK